VTPTSQIVGVKSYFTALGKDTNPVQYVNLIAGYYGKTPFPIDASYREEVCGFRDERSYDSSQFRRDIPTLPGTEIPIAETEQEKLLYYLFPDSSGKAYLEKLKGAAYAEVVKAETERKEREEEARLKKLHDESILNRFAESMFDLSEHLSEAMTQPSTDEDPSMNALILEAAEYTDI